MAINLMMLVIPIAGKDPNFQNTFKPFSNLKGKLLIEHVILQHDLRSIEKIVFITLEEYESKYNVSYRLKSLFGKKAVVRLLSKVTKGAPETIIEGASDIINQDKPILIELGDVARNIKSLYRDIKKYKSSYDGILPVEKKRILGRRWGYVYNDKHTLISLKEKLLHSNSNLATMGLYFFSSGKKFLKGARALIQKNKNMKAGSYLVGSIYNLMIADGYRFRISDNKIVAILSTPNDINAYDKLRS